MWGTCYLQKVRQIFYLRKTSLKVSDSETWVDVGGLSDHLPILLRLQCPECKGDTPYKFNSSWIQEEDYRKLVVDSWSSLEDILNVSFMKQFAENLQRTKKETKKGEKDILGEPAKTAKRS